MAQTVKNLAALEETLSQEDTLKKGMATHSNILAWRIPIDRGAWWATVHGVAKSRSGLSAWARHCVSQSSFPKTHSQAGETNGVRRAVEHKRHRGNPKEWASPVAQTVKNLPAVQKNMGLIPGSGRFLSWSTWRIPWTEESGYSPWGCKELDMTKWLILSLWGLEKVTGRVDRKHNMK